MQPMTEMAKKRIAEQDSYIFTADSLTKEDGEIYSLPWETRLMLLYYRTDIFGQNAPFNSLQDIVTKGAQYSKNGNMAFCLGLHGDDGFLQQLQPVLTYRCLIPKTLNGLIVVGRCISVSHIAHGSTRLMPLAMAEGQAAGIAAKLAVDSNVEVRDVDIRKLQKRLVEEGASLYRDPEAVRIEKERAHKAIKEFLANYESINTPEDVEWFD